MYQSKQINSLITQLNHVVFARRGGIAASIPLYRSAAIFDSLGTMEERVIKLHLRNRDFAKDEIVNAPRDGTSYLHEAKVIQRKGDEVHVEYTTPRFE